MSAAAGPRAHENARPVSASRGPRPNSTRSARSTNTSRSSTSRGRRQAVTGSSIAAHERGGKAKSDSRELEEKYKALQQTRESEKRERMDEDRRKRREATSHQQLLTREHRVAEREFTRREQEMAKLEKSLQKVRMEEDKRNDRQNDFVAKMNETLRRLELRHKELEEELLEKVQEAAEAKGRLAHIEFAHMLQQQGNNNVSVRVERRVDYERITNGEGVEEAHTQAIQPLLDQEMQVQVFEDSLRSEAEELRMLNQRKEEINEQLRQRLEEYEELTRADSGANASPGISRSISWQAQELVQEHPVPEVEESEQDTEANQPQGSEQEPLDGRPEIRTPDSPVTAENWALAHTPPPSGAMSMTYPSGVTVYLPEFVPMMSQVAAQNASQRDRILQEIESGYHMHLLLRACSVRNWDLHGGLSWESGEIATLVSMLFEDLGLVPPRDAQIYPIYSKFSADRGTELDMRECLCVADATLRAVFLQPQPEAPASTGNSSRVGAADRVGATEGVASAGAVRVVAAEPAAASAGAVGAGNGLLSSYKSYEDLPGRRSSPTASGPPSDAGTEQKMLRNARSEPELHGARPASTNVSASVPATIPAPTPTTQAVAVEPNSPGVESGGGSSVSVTQPLPVSLSARPASVLSARPAPPVRVSPGTSQLVHAQQGSSLTSLASAGVAPTSSPQLSVATRAASPPAIGQVSQVPPAPLPARPGPPAPLSSARPSSLVAPAASTASVSPARAAPTAPTSPVRLAPAPQARGEAQFAQTPARGDAQFAQPPRIIRVPTVTNIAADTPQRPAWMNDSPQRATQLPAWMADPAFAGPPTRRQMPATATLLSSSVPPATPKLAASPRPATVAPPARPIGREGSLQGPALSPGRIVTSPLVVRRVSNPRNVSPPPPGDDSVAPQLPRQQQLQQRFAAPSPSPTASPPAGGATSSRSSAHTAFESKTFNDSMGCPMAQLGIDLNNDGVADFVITGPDSNRNGIPDAIDAALAARAGSQVDLGMLSASLVVSVAPPPVTGGARPADATVTPTTPAPWAWNAVEADASNQASPKLFDSPPPIMPSTCVCGNVFMPDAIFCRRCGAKRPTLPAMTA
mmetsp:Transcript_53245/g.99922  ORF Transcript_53245/g.99922 Transcript_53245/m.99922 type:complete len:1094 (-) Transcript_53245:120-3401(-)